jgi:hypothetical protein
MVPLGLAALFSIGPAAHSLTKANRFIGYRASKPITATPEPGTSYWISGPRRDGLDRLYGKSALVVEIDVDVREEYWAEIRKKPEQKRKTHGSSGNLVNPYSSADLSSI